MHGNILGISITSCIRCCKVVRLTQAGEVGLEIESVQTFGTFRSSRGQPGTFLAARRTCCVVVCILVCARAYVYARVSVCVRVRV